MFKSGDLFKSSGVAYSSETMASTDEVGRPQTSPTRSDRRRERTRSKLADAARALIAEKGVAGLRIGEITETADVGRGSFYNHFDSKEDLVEAIVRESLEALASAVLDDLPEDEDPAVRASYADRRFIRLAYDDPTFARLLVNLHHGDDLFATATLPYARVILQRGLKTGRLDVADLDVALIVLAGGALALIRAILAGDAPPDADMAHAESVLRMFGISAEEAREISHRPLSELGPKQ
jgi:AcrR family transcriptional regulator